jgi:hypothetical protein
MYRGLYRKLGTSGALAAAMALSSCVQATRHSNFLVFGTNTSVGLRVGTSAASVPEIQLGYSRQEAVILPLVANTEHATGSDGSDVLNPCDLTKPVQVTGARFAVHPCSLVAINGKALDSYSVLASFGANFDASANTSEVGAKGGLAQYFATGMAAQLLALNGGAAVVATGNAATQASMTKPTDQAVKNLFGDSTAFGLGVAAAQTFPDFRSSLLAKLAAAKDDAEVKDRIAAFEMRAGLSTSMQATCATKQACIAAVNDGDYNQTYAFHADAMTKALDGW